MNVVYRTATHEDAALLADLFRRSFTETFGHLYAPEDLAAFLERLDEKGWRSELGDPAYAVRIAEVDGEPAGFAKLGPPTLPFEPRGAALEIRQLYVLAPWQGTGIARTLMEWMLGQARARHADELFLSVFVDNHRARKFYEGYGFRYVAPYVFKVGNHEDEDHILRLDLKNPE
jgi:ribosomal protein S18 acetylase RimI-like enzyme